MGGWLDYLRMLLGWSAGGSAAPAPVAEVTFVVPNPVRSLTAANTTRSVTVPNFSRSFVVPDPE